MCFQTCGQDPCEYEEREVECVAPRGTCDALSRPPDRRQCGNITCGEWEAGSWSKVGSGTHTQVYLGGAPGTLF